MGGTQQPDEFFRARLAAAGEERCIEAEGRCNKLRLEVMKLEEACDSTRANAERQLDELRTRLATEETRCNAAERQCQGLKLVLAQTVEARDLALKQAELKQDALKEAESKLDELRA